MNNYGFPALTIFVATALEIPDLSWLEKLSASALITLITLACIYAFTKQLTKSQDALGSRVEKMTDQVGTKLDTVSERLHTLTEKLASKPCLVPEEKDRHERKR